jgi:predicted site-specific integrase-resolvase
MPSTNGHGPKRTILYARVSTDEQARSGYSLAQQIEALREYAAREGYEILEEVVETPVRAVLALRGQVWTVCGVSWPAAACR